MKKIWEAINDLIYREKYSLKAVTKIRCPIGNEFISNPMEIPNVLNKHFSSVERKLASNMPSSSNHFSQYLGTIFLNSSKSRRT